MRVITSQLAGGDNNADRVLVTDNAVLVLDGATAFEPVPVDPGEYAESLGHAIARRLSLDPHSPLPDAVAESISTTAHALDLTPGRSPSSTISILRVRSDFVDLYVLGDSPIYFGTSTATYRLADDRLADLGRTRLAPMVRALRAESGYTDKHREALAALQRAQRQFRNTADGYWIAETDPVAARHAFAKTLDLHDVEWAVLGTDGATDHIDATAPEGWPLIATYDQERLDALLVEIDQWERDVDPNGQRRRRAKRHDDKTLAVVPVVNHSAQQHA